MVKYSWGQLPLPHHKYSTTVYWPCDRNRPEVNNSNFKLPIKPILQVHHHIVHDFKANSEHFWSLLKYVKRRSIVSTLKKRDRVISDD